jgi:hypothetical protein
VAARNILTSVRSLVEIYSCYILEVTVYGHFSSSSSSIYCTQTIQLQVKTIGYRICPILDNAPAMEQVGLNYLNYTPNLM